MKFVGSNSSSKGFIEYLRCKSFLVDLSAPLRTSPYLYFIRLCSKVVMALLQNRVPDRHETKSYEQNPVN